MHPEGTALVKADAFPQKTNAKSALRAFVSDQNSNYLTKSIFSTVTYVYTVIQIKRHELFYQKKNHLFKYCVRKILQEGFFSLNLILALKKKKTKKQTTTKKTE